MPTSRPSPRPLIADPGCNALGLWRLLLAGLVVLSHAPELLDGNRGRELLTRAFGTLSFGELAVDGFFLISGYLITASWQAGRGPADFLRKRMLRLYPGFIAASLVCLLVVGPLAGGDPIGVAPGEMAARLLLLRPPQQPGAFAGLPYPLLDGAMWTIAYEFRCYLATMLLGLAGVIARPRAYLALSALLLAALAAGPPLPVLPQPLDALLGTPADDLRFLAIFCAGGCFRLFAHRIPAAGPLALLAGIGLAAGLLVRPLAEPAVALFGGYALFWCAFRLAPPALARIGRGTDLSYGLYLYAWPVQNLLVGLDRTMSPWLLTALALPIAALLGALSWALVERPCLALKSAPLLVRRPAA